MNDQIFDALANVHRRTLLRALVHENPQEAIVDPPPADGDEGDVDPEQRLQEEMTRTHLPKLEAYGFVQWNQATNEIVRGPRFDEIRPLLEWMEGHTETTADLTDRQRDLLWSAVRDGYFEVPRKISLVELAERHDISSKTASEELRRGLDVVVHAAVLGE